MAKCLEIVGAKWTRKSPPLIVLAIFSLAAMSAAGEPLKVCESCEFKTIAAALAAAPGNSEVQIEAGVYKEHDLRVLRPMRIVGHGAVTVDGENSGFHIFHVLSPGVKIQGLTIANSGSSYIKEISGIRVTESADCEISGNRFENTTYGIYFEKSKLCTVRDNVFRGEAHDESSGGNGIHLWQGENIVIVNNDIQGHRDGIYFEFVKGAEVKKNNVTRNIRYGLHFMSSNECDYEDNAFKDNGAGVAVMYSRKISMRRNQFAQNRGVAAYGLLLKEIHEGTIEDNTFAQNSVGLFMEGSNRNSFATNRFAGNGWAIRIMGDCENNKFTKNDIVDNTFDVATNSENNPNEFVENYWSQYQGYDLNHDGIGDVPYRPVSLSSVIMENVDSSFILIKSFLLLMLDEIERKLPSLIPERMKDERPLMKPAGFA